MENRQHQLFYLLPWLGARGVCVNGYGREKEKRMYVCVVRRSRVCNYEIHTVVVVKCVDASYEISVR